MGQASSLTALGVQLNGNNMNEKIINNESFYNKLKNLINKNLRIIILFLVASFLFFISFQLFNFYKINKIHKNSISFFNTQNLEDIATIKNSMTELSNQKNFYSILSNLELIEISIDKKDFKKAISIYDDLLNNKNLNQIYRSAIASKASYKFIDISFGDSSQNYINTIENFISLIDNELINYQGVKLELNYLVKILEVEKNNIEYNSFNEAIDLYNNIMTSEVVSSVIKERVNKIHEFQSYK